MGIRERGGDLRLIHIESNIAKHLQEQIKQHVSPDAERVITDELPAYIPAFIAAGIKGSQHETIRHRDKIYVRGDVYTNTVESAFSLFKRGLIGTYHQLSIKHLQAYLNEFQYRFNRRDVPTRFEVTLRAMTSAKPMPFAQLTAEEQV